MSQQSTQVLRNILVHQRVREMPSCTNRSLDRTGFAGDPNSREVGSKTSNATNKFSPEFRTHAARMVTEHEAEHPTRWAAISSIAARIGYSAHPLNDWVKKAEVDSGKHAGLPSDVARKIKALQRESRELRQANETLRNAFAYFAQAEFDRPTKR